MNLFDNLFGGSGDGKSRVSPTARLTMRAVVSGYIAYLGYKLLSDGASNGGEKQLPEWARISVGVLFLLAGLGFLGYTAYAYRLSYLQEQREAREAEEKEKAEREAKLEEMRDRNYNALSSERYLTVTDAYRDYIAAAEKARTQYKPTDGLFGIGRDARSAPCHEQFYNDLSDALDRFAQEQPEPAEAAAIVGYILSAPAEHREDKLIFPMMYAAAGLAVKLVDRLDPADADALAIEFSENFPKPERMPAQEKVLRALYDRARMM